MLSSKRSVIARTLAALILCSLNVPTFASSSAVPMTKACPIELGVESSTLEWLMPVVQKRLQSPDEWHLVTQGPRIPKVSPATLKGLNLSRATILFRHQRVDELYLRAEIYFVPDSKSVLTIDLDLDTPNAWKVDNAQLIASATKRVEDAAVADASRLHHMRITPTTEGFGARVIHTQKRANRFLFDVVCEVTGVIDEGTLFERKVARQLVYVIYPNGQNTSAL